MLTKNVSYDDAIWHIRHSPPWGFYARQNFHLITVFILPTTVLIVCYCIITRDVWKVYKKQEDDDVLTEYTDNTRVTRTSARNTSSQTMSKTKSNSRRDNRPIYLGYDDEDNNHHQVVENYNHPANSVFAPDNSSRASLEHQGGAFNQATNGVPNQQDRRQSARDHVLHVRQLTLRTSVVLVATYILCWTPYNFAAVWHAVHEDSWYDMAHIIVFLNYLMTLQAAINPWIYGVASLQDLKELICAASLCRKTYVLGIRLIRGNLDGKTETSMPGLVAGGNDGPDGTRIEKNRTGLSVHPLQPLLSVDVHRGQNGHAQVTSHSSRDGVSDSMPGLVNDEQSGAVSEIPQLDFDMAMHAFQPLILPTNNNNNNNNISDDSSSGMVRPQLAVVI